MLLSIVASEHVYQSWLLQLVDNQRAIIGLGQLLALWCCCGRLCMSLPVVGCKCPEGAAMPVCLMLMSLVPEVSLWLLVWRWLWGALIRLWGVQLCWSLPIPQWLEPSQAAGGRSPGSRSRQCRRDQIVQYPYHPIWYSGAFPVGCRRQRWELFPIVLCLHQSQVDVYFCQAGHLWSYKWSYR